MMMIMIMINFGTIPVFQAPSRGDWIIRLSLCLRFSLERGKIFTVPRDQGPRNHRNSGGLTPSPKELHLLRGIGVQQVNIHGPLEITCQIPDDVRWTSASP